MSHQRETRLGPRGLFSLGKKLGRGAFGDIYAGTNVETKQEVAIKLEPVQTRHPQLRNEHRVYNTLNTGAVGQKGVPKVHWYGRQGEFFVLVLDRLGSTLEELLAQVGGTFSLATTLLLADQMIARIQHMHDLHLLHRDIKPDNFMMGLQGTPMEDTVFLIDMGLVKQYRDEVSLVHMKYEGNCELSGTARYVSLNTHLGVHPTRRDDLEAIGGARIWRHTPVFVRTALSFAGFVLVYFLTGTLPWVGVRAATKAVQQERIGQMKMKVSLDELCATLHPVFLQYFRCVRALRYEQLPDYDKLRGLFAAVLASLDVPLARPRWDWRPPSQGAAATAAMNATGTDVTEDAKATEKAATAPDNGDMHMPVVDPKDAAPP